MASADQTDFEQWFQEQVAECARTMDYSKADAAQLLADGQWAHLELQKIEQQMRAAKYIMESADAKENHHLSGLADGFYTEVVRLLPYLTAVLEAVTNEANARINVNQVNRYFGLLKLSVQGGLPISGSEPLTKLHLLAPGIAENAGRSRGKVWYHPEGSEGWIGPTDMALAEQLKYFSGLDVPTTFEKMIENGFAVVGNAIVQRMIDEIRSLASEARIRIQPIEEKDWDDIAAAEAPTPEEGTLARSFIEMLESPPNSAPLGIQAIARGLAAVYKQDPGLHGSDSEIREEAIRQAVNLRGVSPQQVRRDWKRFEAQKDEFSRQIIEESKAIGRRSTPKLVPYKLASEGNSEPSE